MNPLPPTGGQAAPDEGAERAVTTEPVLVEAQTVAPPARDPFTEANMLQAVGLRTVSAEDYRQHQRRLSKPAFQALLAHRRGTYATTTRFPLRPVLRLAAKIAGVFCRNIYGIEPESSVTVGRPLEIGHQHGSVIHRYATIGTTASSVRT